MSGNEQKSRNIPEKHAWLVDNCISRTTKWRGINKTPKCFSCPGDSKELSKKTRRSTYDSNQARTKPWPTRLPTSDNNSPITKQKRTNEKPKSFSTVADCRRKQGDT